MYYLSVEVKIALVIVPVVVSIGVVVWAEKVLEGAKQ
jgi:hypothetical protein